MSDVSVINIECLPRNTYVKDISQREGIYSIIYGKNIQPISCYIPTHIAHQITFDTIKRSIVNITIDNKSYRCITRDIQKEYIKNRAIHIDFQCIDGYKVIHCNIPVFVDNKSGLIRLNKREISIQQSMDNFRPYLELDSKLIITNKKNIQTSDITLHDGAKFMESCLIASYVKT